MKLYISAIIVVQIFTAVFITVRADDCGTNEVYNSCGIASGCVRNCNNRNVIVSCLEVCNPGCFCAQNYIQQYENGPCILQSQCPKT